MPFFGELIAIITVLCWTLSVQFFEAASRRIGSTPVNLIRLVAAFIYFAVLLIIRDGSPVPLDFGVKAWVLLSLSGVAGFFIGDIFLFKALVEIGPRVAMLLHGLAAPTAAVIGFLFLHERYQPIQWLGIMVAICGVGLVVSEKAGKHTSGMSKNVRVISAKGVVYGLGAMIGQALGFILSKAGMQTETGYLDAFSATQIRVISGLVCFLLFFMLTNRWGRVVKAAEDKKAIGFTLLGASVGPFLGVSLSLLALHYLPTGVAATILSLVPVCIIPFAVFIHKEHVSLRAVIGALVAFGGIYLLVS